MAKTLSFTDMSPRTVKIGDTTTSFTLVCGNDNVATDLTKVTSITAKLGNASGYLKSATVDPASLTDPTTGQVTVNFNADLMTSLTAGSYSIEVWVVDSTGTSIYPSDGSTGFTITNNIQSANGSTITTITFDDFVKAMNKAASTIAKGDPGEGLDIKGQVTSVSALPTTANEGDGYLVNEELYVYTSGAWKDCGPIQGPQGIQGKTGTGISSTTIQYQISSSATTSPTGTWSNSIVATTITNPYLWMKATLNYTDGTTKDFYLVSQKGDKGDKGDTGTVDNAGLTAAPAFVNLQTQVNNSAVGTNLITDTRDFDNPSAWNFWFSWNKTGEKFNGLTVMAMDIDWGGLTQTIQAKKGETYTFSVYARYKSGTGKSIIYFDNKGNGISAIFDKPNVQVSLNETWQRVSGTFTITADGLMNPRIERTDDNSNTLLIAGPKLEKGSIATDWCPNPTEILTQSDYAKIQASIVSLGGHLS